MADAHKNFAASLVATAPSPATSGTSLVVTGGDGTKFPTPPFNATIWPVGVQPTAANAEIVRVTAISTDTFTIARQQEGASARTVVVGDQISANITARTLTDAENPLNGVTGGTLATSADYVAVDSIEVSATDSLEVPATSTLEVEPIINFLVGEIKMFGGSQVPAGWFFCDGSTVSRTTYAGLFRVIGTIYGAGDGSTTFTLPDFRGRSPVGVGTGSATGATAMALGSTPTTGAGGEQTHVQLLAELAAHAHNMTYAANSTAGGTASLYAGNNTGSNTTASASVGSSTAMNILQPMVVVNFIIRY
jgi:microcystin-dependent protein